MTALAFCYAPLTPLAPPTGTGVGGLFQFQPLLLVVLAAGGVGGFCLRRPVAGGHQDQESAP